MHITCMSVANLHIHVHIPVLTQSSQHSFFSLSLSHITHITHTHTHTHTLTQTHNRSGQMKLKPVIIRDYNQHMLGVDKLDQFASYYSFLHKSVK